MTLGNTNNCKDFRDIFGNIDINKYEEAAKTFRPKKIKVLFIAESPPAYDFESQ